MACMSPPYRGFACWTCKYRCSWGNKRTTDPLFERFKKDFSFIPQDNLRLWVWLEDYTARSLTFLASCSTEVLEWAERHLMEESFGRDDYRELCELMVHFLGGELIGG